MHVAHLGYDPKGVDIGPVTHAVMAIMVNVPRMLESHFLIIAVFRTISLFRLGKLACI